MTEEALERQLLVFANDDMAMLSGGWDRLDGRGWNFRVIDAGQHIARVDVVTFVRGDPTEDA